MSISPSVQLITNATVAQYIHEISVRHRPRDPETRAGRIAPVRAEAAALRGRARRGQTTQPTAA